MEELSISTGSDFINDGWFEIKEDTSWNMLTGSSFGEKGVEGIITSSNRLIRWHLTIWLDTVLKAEELPACVTDLETALSNVDRNNFSHGVLKCLLKSKK